MSCYKWESYSLQLNFYVGNVDYLVKRVTDSYECQKSDNSHMKTIFI